MILCEACPCDTSRSTGECIVVMASSSDQQKQSSSSDSRSSAVISNYPQIKCTQCIEPYVGAKCNDCQNEGIDYYKNENGECVKCFCNNNAAVDVNSPLKSPLSSNRRRKCNSITGMCIDCMFNTTGRNCDKCLPGYVGDAIKRTCVLRPEQPASKSPSQSSVLISSSSRNGLLTSSINNFYYYKKKRRMLNILLKFLSIKNKRDYFIINRSEIVNRS